MRSVSRISIGSLPVKWAEDLHEHRERIKRRHRQADLSRLLAAHPCDRRLHPGQRIILAAEDVALAWPALGVGQEVTGGAIVDMDEVEASIDIGRHPAGGGHDD